MTGASGALAAFCQRWQTAIPALAISRAVHDTFPDLSEMTPPINLLALAQRRGVTDVVTTHVSGDGEIALTGNRTFAIRLSAKQDRYRTRFTLAHEIAHTFLVETEQTRAEPDDRHVASFRLPLGTPLDLEWWCDRLATELIMPAKQFGDELDAAGLGCLSLLRIARKFNVSLQAAAVRTSGLAPARVIVVKWQHHPDRNCLYSVWTVGLQSVANAGAPLVLASREPAYQLFSTADRFGQRVWMSLGAAIDKYFVDGLARRTRNGRQLLTVIVLDKHAERFIKLPSPECEPVLSSAAGPTSADQATFW